MLRAMRLSLAIMAGLFAVLPGGRLRSRGGTLPPPLPPGTYSMGAREQSYADSPD
jgi:hypothetical protein